MSFLLALGYQNLSNIALSVTLLDELVYNFLATLTFSSAAGLASAAFSFSLVLFFASSLVTSSEILLILSSLAPVAVEFLDPLAFLESFLSALL